MFSTVPSFVKIGSVGRSESAFFLSFAFVFLWRMQEQLPLPFCSCHSLLFLLSLHCIRGFACVRYINPRLID